MKDTQPVSPSLAVPLVRAAYAEDRPELQKFWAELIAAAMDPRRSSRVRLSFIETLKRFDPWTLSCCKSSIEVKVISRRTRGTIYLG